MEETMDTNVEAGTENKFEDSTGFPAFVEEPSGPNKSFIALAIGGVAATAIGVIGVTSAIKKHIKKKKVKDQKESEKEKEKESEDDGKEEQPEKEDGGSKKDDSK